MTTYIPTRSPVGAALLQPLIEAYKVSARRYNCTELTDLDFLEMCVLRTVCESKTGRDFIQRHSDFDRKDVTVDLFFKALKSERRLANATSVNLELEHAMQHLCPDPVAAIPELDGFSIYAGDGHYHGAAAHDLRIKSSDGEMKKYPTGHFFMLNMRSHHMRHLATAEQGAERKNEHDMRVIKRLSFDALRGGQPKGTKVILAWDPAGIDFDFWQKAKAVHGLYFLSQEKSNMNLTVVESRPFDPDLPEYSGVISDEIVVPASDKRRLRRITYVDETSGIIYKPITTEMTLPAWIHVLIYKQRWDIEKVFDEFKSKLSEQKSWASGETAKSVHATALCLAHNLMILLEHLLARDHGVENTKEMQRRQSRAAEAIEQGASFVATFFQRFTVRSLKFIRWLRNMMYQTTSWEGAVGRLAYAFTKY